MWKKKGAIIDSERHRVLKSPHPSLLSAHRGFIGNKHFSKTNKLMRAQGLQEIDWLVPDLRFSSFFFTLIEISYAAVTDGLLVFFDVRAILASRGWNYKLIK